MAEEIDFDDEVGDQLATLSRTVDRRHRPNESRLQIRREAHTQAEKKRRDAIRKGYDDLAKLGNKNSF